MGNALTKGGGVRALDAVASNVFYAFSTRRLLTSYAGPCMRVRRSSDNAEQDIGFGTDGWLDTTALLAFAGAGSAFAKTWYDQSGNGRDHAQTTTGQQPRIVNSGAIETAGGRPAIRPDGVDDNLANASVAWSAADFLMLAVATLTAGGSTYRTLINIGETSTVGVGVVLYKGSTLQDWVQGDAGADGNGFGSGRAPRTIPTTPGFADSAIHQHDFAMAAAGSDWFTDGSAKTLRVSSAGQVPAVTASSLIFTTTSGFTGFLSELVLLNAVPATRSAIRQSQKTAFSTP